MVSGVFNTGTTKSPDGYSKSKDYKVEIIWVNVLLLAFLHIVFLYGIYNLVTFQVTLGLYLFHRMYTMILGFGITAGAHRLWTHRSYKANLPLRIILMLMFAGSMQTDIFVWVRDHRVHHKYTDSNADPHNSQRGFFFSHVGWLMCKKHPDVIEQGKKIDLSDVLADPVVRFERKYHIPLGLFIGFFIPTYLSMLMFNEALWRVFLGRILAYTFLLNYTWLVNSAAHMWGAKPYDKHISPSENKLVSLLTSGEGWHNYHHVFPWDYKTAELGNYELNFTTAFIDLMAKIGWATDLKTASNEMILKRMEQSGSSVLQEKNEMKITF